jgi:hypothetical protein
MSIGPIRTRRWLPSRRLARRSRGPLLGGIWLRVLTIWSAADLDRQLARGVDPTVSDELSLRVGQLRSVGTRTRLGCELRRAVQMANGLRAPLITTRLRGPAIRENDELLLTLADRLHGGELLGVRGLAMTARLVRDRSGPLYRAGVSGSLQATAMEALDALGHGHWTAGPTGA